MLMHFIAAARINAKRISTHSDRSFYLRVDDEQKVTSCRLLPRDDIVRCAI
jgi:hypothetical protein